MGVRRTRVRDPVVGRLGHPPDRQRAGHHVPGTRRRGERRGEPVLAPGHRPLLGRARELRLVPVHLSRMDLRPRRCAASRSLPRRLRQGPRGAGPRRRRGRRQSSRVRLRQPRRWSRTSVGAPRRGRRWPDRSAVRPVPDRQHRPLEGLDRPPGPVQLEALARERQRRLPPELGARLDGHLGTGHLLPGDRPRGRDRERVAGRGLGWGPHRAGLPPQLSARAGLARHHPRSGPGSCCGRARPTPWCSPTCSWGR